MPNNSPDEPSEIELLRERLHRLELRAHLRKADAPKDRTLKGAFAFGALALFLSPALPWARSGGGTRFLADGTVGPGATGGHATGWNVFGAALTEANLVFLLVCVSLLTLIRLSLSCLKGTSRRVLVSTVVFSALTPALFFLGWLPSLTTNDVFAGSGVFVMVVACTAIGWAARESIIDERFK